MPTLSTTARNAAASAVVGLLNGGTLEIQTSGAAVLAVLTFGATAFGAPATGVATANAITRDETANATGTAALFVAKNSTTGTEISGTVGIAGSGADLIVTTTSIVAGQPVEITSLTYTQPATV